MRFALIKGKRFQTGFFSKNFFDQVKKQVTETPWINRRRSERLTTVEGRTVQWDRKRYFYVRSMPVTKMPAGTEFKTGGIANAIDFAYSQCSFRHEELLLSEQGGSNFRGGTA